MVQLCKKVADARWFQNSVTIAILCAGVLVGIETYPETAKANELFLTIANRTILGIFVIEVIVKMVAEAPKPLHYFKDGWNVFDFIIVAAAFLPFGGSSIAILRLLRLLRVLKLIKALPKLQMLVGALMKSIPSMGYVSILLLLLFYIYAVAGVFFFGENDPIHFENLQTSMLSLFRVVTLEDWTDVMYINMFGCENYGYDGNEALCTDSYGSPGGSAFFFVSFVLIGTMIFLNLFIGVIMNGMDEARAEMDASDQKDREDAGEAKITIEDVEMKMEEMQKMLAAMKNNRAN